MAKQAAASGILSNQAAELGQILMAVGGMNDAAGGKNQQRFEERVREQMEQAADPAPDSDGHEHQPELGDGAVGEDAAKLALEDAAPAPMTRLIRPTTAMQSLAVGVRMG